jgi:ribosomal protein S1
MTVRGVVTAVEAGKSVTVTLQKGKKNLTYTLTEGASVPGDLKPGDAVKVRILVTEKGRVADRVVRLEKK